MGDKLKDWTDDFKLEKVGFVLMKEMLDVVLHEISGTFPLILSTSELLPANETSFSTTNLRVMLQDLLSFTSTPKVRTSLHLSGSA